MKKGDLVKVSNKGFTAIGCVTKVCDTGYYIVHYFAQLGKDTDRRIKGGLWSKKYVHLLKEVEDEKDVSKT